MKRLPRSFYTRPALIVAKELLGKLLVRRTGGKCLAGKIVEVEAYLGREDPASHAYRGKTKRNEVMFNRGGYLYVYFTYGMHYCSNVVTGKNDEGNAVLIRAIEPVGQIKSMIRNRGGSKADGSKNFQDKKIVNLTNGPAKLCQALGISGRHNGVDLTKNEIFITGGDSTGKVAIASSGRIGITSGLDKKWRFYIRGNRFVSKINKKNAPDLPRSI